MSRNFPDWIKAYCDYASHSEAPQRMHFWTSISAIAGVLRRRVWIDMQYFVWTPCFYIVLVAPPGIVSKSTTAGVGMDLLRKVPGIKFGPQAVTWPALVKSFEESLEHFPYNDEFHAQSALTLESSEFGNLINPEDREMIDLLVTLWDSKQGAFTKITKGSGTNVVENPWINLIACTTPSWIEQNFPEYSIGGGFASRCIWVYADKKAKLVAYPYKHSPEGMSEVRLKLIQDLEYMSINLVGPYKLTAEAERWGELWYATHYASIPQHLNDDRFSGYRARKQTHLHKLALVLAASARDEPIITVEDLATAEIMLTELEADMPKVFDKIGRTDDSVQAERFINFVKSKEEVDYSEAYRYIHLQFPNFRDFESILSGAVRAGYLIMKSEGSRITLKYLFPEGKEKGGGTNTPGIMMP